MDVARTDVSGTPHRLAVIAAFASAVLISLLPTGAAESAVGIDFAHRIVPLLERYCAEWHIGVARQGGFSMNTREKFMAGGDSGAAGLVAAHAAAGEIIRRIRSADPAERMPADGEPLPNDAVASLVARVDGGVARETGFSCQGVTSSACQGLHCRVTAIAPLLSPNSVQASAHRRNSWPLAGAVNEPAAARGNSGVSESS